MWDPLKEKPSTGQPHGRVEAYTVNFPAEIMSRYHSIVLAGDIMFVNKIAFLMTVSQYIKFGTAEMMKNQQNKAILAAIKHVAC